MLTGSNGGENLKNETEVRETLITNTIRLISVGGFEMATTRAIVHSGEAPKDMKLNEVYIYRLFGGKEKLYEEAFRRLDNQLVSALVNCLKSVGPLESDPRNQLYKVFVRTWRFLLNNEANCRCYVRYYYSVYFRGESLVTHRNSFDKIVAAFAPLFKEEADVTSIMHSVLTTLLDFAIRVYNEDLEDNNVNAEHIFNVLYCSMQSYFKSGIQIPKSSE